MNANNNGNNNNSNNRIDVVDNNNNPIDVTNNNRVNINDPVNINNRININEAPPVVIDNPPVVIEQPAIDNPPVVIEQPAFNPPVVINVIDGNGGTTVDDGPVATDDTTIVDVGTDTTDASNVYVYTLYYTDQDGATQVYGQYYATVAADGTTDWGGLVEAEESLAADGIQNWPSDGEFVQVALNN